MKKTIGLFLVILLICSSVSAFSASRVPSKTAVEMLHFFVTTVSDDKAGIFCDASYHENSDTFLIYIFGRGVNENSITKSGNWEALKEKITAMADDTAQFLPIFGYENSHFSFSLRDDAHRDEANLLFTILDGEITLDVFAK